MRLPTLRTIADTALLIAAVAVATVAGQTYYHTRAQGKPPEVRIVKPHERVNIAGVDFTLGQRTMLLVLRSSCPFCEKSMPFYSKMMANRSQNSRVIVVGAETETVLANYLKLHDIAVDGVATVTADSTPSQATPTAILVDRDGVVNNVWRGVLGPERETEVLQLMSQ
jgi:Redoxin